MISYWLKYGNMHNRQQPNYKRYTKASSGSKNSNVFTAL